MTLERKTGFSFKVDDLLKIREKQGSIFVRSWISSSSFPTEGVADVKDPSHSEQRVFSDLFQVRCCVPIHPVTVLEIKAVLSIASQP